MIQEQSLQKSSPASRKHSSRKPRPSTRSNETAKQHGIKPRRASSTRKGQEDPGDNCSSVHQLLLSGTDYFNCEASDDPLTFIRTHGLEDTLGDLAKTLQSVQVSSKRSKSHRDAQSKPPTHPADPCAPSDLTFSQSSCTPAATSLPTQIHWPLIAHKLAHSLKQLQSQIQQQKDQLKQLNSLSSQNLQTTSKKYDALLGLKDAEILNLKEQQSVMQR